MADFLAVDLNRVEYAGAAHDPVAALLLCSPVTVDLSYVHGRAVVRERRPVAVETEALLEEHNRAARRLLRGG